MSDRFGERYWREESHYRRFGDYEAALEATTQWYQGLLRLVGDRLPRRGRHIDAGCGHGALVHLMTRRGLSSFGVDASSWVVDEAKAYAPALADRFAVADVQESLVFEGSFDLITSLEVVGHLENPRSAIAAMAQKLAPGGALLLSTPNPANRIPGNDPATSDPTHVNLHAPGWWREAIERQGLTVEREWTYYPVPLLWRVSPLFARWISLPRSVGPGYLIFARL
jgi:2-polyprenyl-3-methyl-5-hydroxy-6-metoxy-1,4-benzoquinol methylase